MKKTTLIASTLALSLALPSISWAQAINVKSFTIFDLVQAVFQVAVQTTQQVTADYARLNSQIEDLKKQLDAANAKCSPPATNEPAKP